MIYLFSQGINLKPAGGVKVLYDIVRTLNQLGYQSKLLINGGEYSPQWFQSSNIEIENNIDNVTQNDVVVFHEETLWVYDRIKASGCKHIILNQGAHWSLTNYLGYERTKQIYYSSSGIFANSTYTQNLINKLFGNDLNVERFHIPIDSSFKPGTKTNTICYMPRRNSETAECIAQYVKGKYPQWQCVAIDNMSHEQVANVFSSAKIFLSFGGPEGFGMPPLEAAFSGCHVIGYSGFGGDEYFVPPFFTPIPFMEIISFIDAIDHRVNMLVDRTSVLESYQLSMLRETYSVNTFTKDIGRIFNKFLK